MYPMTLASQVAHLVMRFQQDVAELVIKGDETLTVVPAEGRAARVGDVRRGRARRPDGATAPDDAIDGDRRTEGRFALYSTAG